MGSELEELKKRRIKQLEQAYAEQLQSQNAETQLVQAQVEHGTTGPGRQQSTWGQHAEAEMAQQLEAIEEAVKAHLTREALHRYGTLKLAHPETAARLVLAVAQAIETGRIIGVLSDEQMVSVLKQLSQLQPQRSGIKIVRK